MGEHSNCSLIVSFSHGKTSINHLILCNNHSKCGYVTICNNSCGECIIYEKDIKGIQPRTWSKILAWIWNQCKAFLYFV
jgi:hypothetical protein